MQRAIVAAGCFWGVQFYFDQVPGVVETRVGYTGGQTDRPSYEDVCYHDTGHAEAVKITFNPDEITYETIVRQFFRMHDATQLNRQGADVGDQYRSAIFYVNDAQKQVAQQVRDDVQSVTKKPILTQIVPEATFYEAEGYHQKFAERTGRGVCHVPYEPIKS